MSIILSTSCTAQCVVVNVDVHTSLPFPQLPLLFLSILALWQMGKDKFSGISVKETLLLSESIQCCCIDFSLSIVLSAHGTVAKLMGLYTILYGSLGECLKLRLRLN